MVMTGVGAAALLIAIPVSFLAIGGSGELEITLLDTGDADALIVTTPHGHHVLIDGGSSGIELARGLGAVLPHWQHDIDAAFVLEADAAHAGAVPELARRYDIAHQYGGDGVALSRGSHYDIDGVSFDILWPMPGAPSTDGGDVAALRVSYRGVSLLAVADLSPKAQAEFMAQSTVIATILVLPHNGANKTDAPFIGAVAPAIALVPVGTGTYAATPAATTTNALGGRPLLRTDEHGRITIRTDGHRIAYSTER
jgi:competence protein ComEC